MPGDPPPAAVVEPAPHAAVVEPAPPAAVVEAAWVCEAAREMGHTVPEGRKARFDALLDVALAPHTGASAPGILHR